MMKHSYRLFLATVLTVTIPSYCLAGRVSGLDRFAVLKSEVWESPDVDWVNWVVINTQPTGPYNKPWTDEERLEFLVEHDPGILDWQSGLYMNPGDFCRMRGLPSSGSMEPGMATCLAGLECIAGDFAGNGIALNEKGQSVRDSYTNINMTMLAPKWFELTKQCILRPGLYGDADGRDNIMAGIHFPYTQFGEWDNRQFVRYMLESYSKKELADMGFEAEGFNILDYVAKQRETMGNPQLIEEPVIHEYIRFYYMAVIERIILYGEATKQANLKNGQSVTAYYGNASSSHLERINGIPAMAQTDLAWIEETGWQAQYPYGNTLATGDNPLIYKVGRAATNYRRPVWGFGFAQRYANKNNEVLLNAVCMAEAAANGGVFWEEFFDYPKGSPVWYVFRHQNQFLSKNRVLFTDRTAPVEVAIGYSFPSLFWRWFSTLETPRPHREQISAAARLLEDQHIPFELLMLGHPDLLTEQLERLDKYRMLILPDTDCISDRQSDAIKKWVKRGGKLVLWGEVGTRDEEMHRRTEPAFSELMNDPGREQVVSTTSAGMFLDPRSELPHSITEAYRKKMPGAEKVIAKFVKLDKPLVETDLPELVSVNVWQHGAGPMTSVQIVNYNIDPNSSDFTPMNDFTIRLKVEKGVKYNKATYFTTKYLDASNPPPAPQELTFKQQDGYVEVKVPHLEVFGVVTFSVEHELEARVAAAEVRKWYERLKIAKRCRGQNIEDVRELLDNAKSYLRRIQGDVKVRDFASFIKPGRDLAASLRKEVEKVTEQVTSGLKKVRGDILKVEAVHKFDVGESGTEDGWTEVTTKSEYSKEKGFGWTSVKHISAAEALGAEDAVNGDYIRATDPVEYTEGEYNWFRSPFQYDGAAAFRVDLPGGNYLVTVISGDTRNYYNALRTSTTAVDANGLPELYGDRYYAGYYQNRSFRVFVDDDGQLNLRFWGNGDGPYYFNNCEWLVNGIIIQEAASEPTAAAAKYLAESEIRSNAALRKWLVVGPFDDDDCEGLYRTFPPENELGPDVVYDGKHGAVKWQRADNLRGDAPYLNLTDILKDTDEVAAFALTHVYSEKAREALLIGSMTQLGVGYVNGEKVFQDELAGGLLGSEERVQIKLKKGWNSILLKSLNHSGPDWALWSGLLTTDGKPLTGIETMGAFPDKGKKYDMGHDITPAQVRHAELVQKANAVVAKRWEENRTDPLYPIYHVRSQAHWINDPNGPIFYDGKYHLFFQQEIYTDLEQKMDAVGRGWGHVASDDLVYWEHWPIAIVPSEPYDSYDKEKNWIGGCWSGTCIVGPDGLPTIIYSVRPEGGQGMAKSYDGMKTWVKHPDNPVLKWWEGENRGFRDPFAWKEGDTYYVIIGSQWNDDVGIYATATLYESKDLVNWQFVHPLFRGHEGIFYECPGMLPFGDKYIFWASLSGLEKSITQCVVGDYKDKTFIPQGDWQFLHFGADGSFYAPTGMIDQKGRVIMWGYIGCRGHEPVRIIDGKEKTFRWSQVQSVPRHLFPRPDGRVGMEPIPELKQLRGKGYRFVDITQKPDSPNILKDIKGDALEIIAEFENIDADSYGLDVWRSEDGSKSVPIVYHVENERFDIGTPGGYGSVSGEFHPLEDEKTVRMHIFIDKLVVEAYLNKREYIAYGSGLRQPEELGLSVIATGGSVKIQSLDIWEMNSCYK